VPAKIDRTISPPVSVFFQIQKGASGKVWVSW